MHVIIVYTFFSVSDSVTNCSNSLADKFRVENAIFLALLANASSSESSVAWF